MNHKDRAGGNYKSKEAAVIKTLMGLYRVK